MVFTSVFVLEAVAKLVALNPTNYFVDNWNVLDFIIVIGSIVDVALAGASVSIGFLRLFRIARIAKLASFKLHTHNRVGVLSVMPWFGGGRTISDVQRMHASSLPWLRMAWSYFLFG